MDHPDGDIATRAHEELRQTLQAATLGEYEVYGELGRGGMATVFLAHEIALDRPVAIKVLDPALVLSEGMVERFRREARTAASLNHPHIIPIYGVRETDRLVYFVMKCVKGRSLDLIMREAGPLPIPVVKTVLAEIGAALAHAHDRGVVHRDIKPGNIMLDDEGWAVLTDFGIAKVEAAPSLTSTTDAVGTPYYMSPEQAAKEAVTPQSDQYSLGVVGYEMITGHPPFEAESVRVLMHALLFDQPPRVDGVRPECPPDLAQVIGRMLEKEPANRFPDLKEVVSHLHPGPVDATVRQHMITLARSGPIRVTAARVPTSPAPASKIPQSRAPAPKPGRRPVAWLATATVATGVVILAWAARGAEWREPPNGPDTTASAPAGITVPNTSTPPGDEPDPQAHEAAGPAPPRRATEPNPGPLKRSPSTASPPLTSDAPPSVVPPVTAPPALPDAAWVRLGTKHERAAVYLNGQVQLPWSPSLRWWRVAPGRVTLMVAAEGCRPWETVVVVNPGDSLTVGYRNPVCEP